MLRSEGKSGPGGNPESSTMLLCRLGGVSPVTPDWGQSLESSTVQDSRGVIKTRLGAVGRLTYTALSLNREGHAHIPKEV